MLVEIRRCKHCKSIYNYHATGDGCLHPYNDGEYCPECMKLIKKALCNVPEKFVAKYQEIENAALVEELEKFKEVQLEEERQHKRFGSIVSTRATATLDFDVIDLYDWDAKEYAVCCNKDTPEEKHLFILKEYDTQKKEFTYREWDDYKRAKKKDYRYWHAGQNFMKTMTKVFSEVKPIKLEEPTKELHIEDFTWEIVTCKEPTYEPSSPLVKPTCPKCGSSNVSSKYFRSDEASWRALAGRAGFKHTCKDCDHYWQEITSMS